MNEVLEINRIVYNHFVEHNFTNRNDMNYALTELKEQWPVLKRYHSKMLQMISTKVAGALESMRVKKQNGHRVGKLYYLLNYECNSFVYNQSGYRIEQLLDGDNRCLLHLSKIGQIEIRIHRRLHEIKQMTIIRQAGRWYAIACCKIDRIIKETRDKPVGIDVGIKNYVYDSDGGHVDNPLFMKKDLPKVRRSNKRLSRRVYGSNNYHKALRWHQRLHQRITNKRSAFLHDLSNTYAQTHDIVFVEKLQLPNMVKNHCLAKHILDSAWGTFKSFLKYKVQTFEVDPYNSTIECSQCDAKVPKTLAIRIHECPVCGLVLDRDHNSANVILQRGMKSLSLLMQHEEVTPVETLSRVAEAGTSPHPFGVGS